MQEANIGRFAGKTAVGCITGKQSLPLFPLWVVNKTESGATKLENVENFSDY